MKTIFITLILSLLSFSSMASTISCTTVSAGHTYYLTIKIDMNAEKATLFMLNSHNATTRRGGQSMGPVGGQTFDMSRGEDEEYCECGPRVLKKPLPDTNYYSRENKFDFTKVKITELDDGLKVNVKGPALPFGRLTFRDCEKIND